VETTDPTLSVPDDHKTDPAAPFPDLILRQLAVDRGEERAIRGAAQMRMELDPKGSHRTRLPKLCFKRMICPSGLTPLATNEHAVSLIGSTDRTGIDQRCPRSLTPGISV